MKLPSHLEPFREYIAVKPSLGTDPDVYVHPSYRMYLEQNEEIRQMAQIALLDRLLGAGKLK